MGSLNEVNDVLNADPVSSKEPGSFLATDEVGVVSLDEVNDIVGMVSLDEVNDIPEGDMVSLKEYDMLDIDETDMFSLEDEREVLGKDWIAMGSSSELISDPV
jgi:Tfp pilus assembly protein FimV